MPLVALVSLVMGDLVISEVRNVLPEPPRFLNESLLEYQFLLGGILRKIVNEIMVRIEGAGRQSKRCCGFL